MTFATLPPCSFGRGNVRGGTNHPRTKKDQSKMKILEPNEEFQTLAIAAGNLIVGPVKTVRCNGENPVWHIPEAQRNRTFPVIYSQNYKLAVDEFTDGNNTFSMKDVFPVVKISGLPTAAPWSLAASCAPSLMCRPGDVAAAALALRQAYIEACAAVEIELQDAARQLHALAFRAATDGKAVAK